jgi:hypothetical protein
MNFQVPWNKELFLKILVVLSFPQKPLHHFLRYLAITLASNIFAVEVNTEGTGNGLSMTQVAYY